MGITPRFPLLEEGSPSSQPREEAPGLKSRADLFGLMPPVPEKQYLMERRTKWGRGERSSQPHPDSRPLRRINCAFLPSVPEACALGGRGWRGRGGVGGDATKTAPSLGI